MNTIWTGAVLWLVQISVAASCLILLTLLLARFTRQPARRQRLCEAGLAAALLAAAVSIAPAWLVIALPIHAQDPAAGEAGLPAKELIDFRADPNTSVPDERVAAMPIAALPESDIEPAPPDRPGFSLVAAIPVGLLALYGAGMVYFLLRWLIGMLALRRLLGQTEPAPAQVLEMLGMANERCPRLLVSRRLRVPISCGVWRPTVVLPIAFCQPGAAGRLRWVLAHELTHIERKDALSAVLFALGQVVFFHLPWFWMLRRQVRLCQEYVADATAVAERPADEYAEFLLTLTETKPLPLLTAGVGGPVSDLFRRVTMLLQNPFRIEKHSPRLWTWGLACVLLVLAALLGGVGLRAAAADTIIIIIPGKQTTEPVKNQAPDAKKTTKEAPIDYLNIIRFTDKGTIVQKLAPPQDDPTRVIRVRAAQSLAELPDARKQPPPLADQEKLKKVIRDLEEILKIRPDAKELRELIHRLKAAQGLSSQEKRQNLYQPVYPVDPKKITTILGPGPGGVLPYGYGNPAGQFTYKFPGTDPGSGRVDWKKLETLLEQIQKAPDKVDPKEINKALEEIRKAAGHAPRVVELPYDQLVRQYLRAANARGRFGLRFSPPSTDLREHLGLPKDQGLVIEEVSAGTPAAKAGLKVKDIVLKLNDQPIPSDPNQAAKMFADVKDGTSVDLTILRKGKEAVIKGIKAGTSSAGNFPYRFNDVKGLVTIRTDGGMFTVQQIDKQLSITIKGTLKDGKGTVQEIRIEVEGKEAYKGRAAGVPEAWRSRVQRLLQLIRAWHADPQSGAPEPRFRDPSPKGATLPTDPNRNPPAALVKGKVEKVDGKDGLVEISIGSDEGLKKNHTLEVYRLRPKAEYLGTLRLLEVYQVKAVGRMIRNNFANRDNVRPGDEVASSLNQP